MDAKRISITFISVLKSIGRLLWKAFCLLSDITKFALKGLGCLFLIAASIALGGIWDEW